MRYIVENMDPFFMQLILVPLVVIGLGVLCAVFTKRIYVAPIVTLLWNLSYETWYFNSFYPEHHFSYSSWNIIFPIVALCIAGFMIIGKSKFYNGMK